MSASGRNGGYIVRNPFMHIGKRIKDVFGWQPKGRTVTWFAEQLNCHRVNVYDIFNRTTIDTELLRRISVILDHDFFKDLSEEFHELSEKKADVSGPPEKR